MSVNRIKGKDGVVLESNAFLELPKAQSKVTTFAERAGMFRYNSILRAFEGVLEFDDGSLEYRRLPSLDSNGRLSTSLLPDSVVSGMLYKGTYSVLMDDIDPPLGEGLYHPLPNPSSSNSGNYFIVSGILDAAISHYNINNPTANTTTFIPANPSSQGNWLEIKYYISDDPNRVGKKIVTSAFGRIIKSAIPGSGHSGLVSLSKNSDLTNPFNSMEDPSSELALSDGDWVISNGIDQQRLRSTRTSILASQVIYDRTLVNSTGRSFERTAGTSQTAIDNLQMYTVRRTGDSMCIDPDSPAQGRLALVYGTAAKPALTFSDGDDDLSNDSGLDPSKWTDSGTGLFRQAAGSIGVSSNGLERVRIENTKFVLFQTGTTNVSTNPTLQFNHSSNTNNVGISGMNNTLSFSVKNSEQLTIADKLTTVKGSLTVESNTILGTTKNDTLVVNASSTFNAPVQFNDNVSISGDFDTSGDNYFDKTVRINKANGIKLVTNKSDVTGEVKIYHSTTGGIRFDVTNQNTDVSIWDGTKARTTFNYYGIKLPILQPVDDTKGLDGMIAYAPDLKSSVQKIDGRWRKIGAGGWLTTTFTKSNWQATSDGRYSFKVVTPEPIVASVQEKNTDGSYNQVEVDQITYTANDVTIYVSGGSVDLRFDGRLVVSS